MDETHWPESSQLRCFQSPNSYWYDLVIAFSMAPWVEGTGEEGIYSPVIASLV
jgi:hypothetical protein